MHDIQRQRTADLLRSKGIDRALFANPDSVTWLTGFAPPVQLGGNYFAGGPSLVWYADGTFSLILLDAYAGFREQTDIPVHAYQGYDLNAPINSVAHLSDLLREVIGGTASGTLGIEQNHLTASLDAVLRDTVPDRVTLQPVDGWLVPLRMVKTEEEMALLRRNFALTDLGHRTLREAVRPGQREIDVWMAAHTAINGEAGQRVPLGNDCVVGYRQGNIGGWPEDYVIKEDSSLIVDLSTVLGGYWSDSCATYYGGEMTSKQAAMHRTAREALDLAASLIRPGAVAREVDARVRDFISKAGYPVYPHHTGHGVGVAPHEAPRIVPYNDMRLEAGMVIMLEPGIYFAGETSVRLENAYLVTVDGAEQLTHHLDLEL